MAMLRLPAGAKEASIVATVIRADGSIEHLGQVTYWHRNPLKRVANRLAYRFRRLIGDAHGRSRPE
jgi:hypothetical protein